MNILSLFDGIGGARIALDRLGIKFEKYFSSEINQPCIQTLNSNYDDIIHLGDIREIKKSDLPSIDLFIGGSPCQDLSNAQIGQGLKGESSGLFYEYVRLLNEVNPKYFVLENVKNKWGNIMSDIVGISHIEINSHYFSAQFRPRYYWTNIAIDVDSLPSQTNPLVLNDIIEDDVDEKYFLPDEKTEEILKSVQNIDRNSTPIKKLFTIPKHIHNDNERQRRVYSIEGKSPTLLARADTTKILINDRIRKITPLECERLQGLPDNYTQICSDTQRYKMIGNGFTIGVIEFILSFINKPPRKRTVSQNADYYLSGKKNQAKQIELL